MDDTSDDIAGHDKKVGVIVAGDKDYLAEGSQEGPTGEVNDKIAEVVKEVMDEAEESGDRTTVAPSDK